MRPGQDVLGSDLLVAGQQGDPDADHDRGAQLALAEHCADVAGDDQRLVLTGLGQDQRELIAAEAGHHVGGAGSSAQELGDGLQHDVAGGPAVGVVGQLEVALRVRRRNSSLIHPEQVD